MNSHGRDSQGSPDVTARVMQRLGYQDVTPSQARRIRRRSLAIHAVQGVAVLCALVLGAVWWFDGGVPGQRGPEVVGSLRGSVARSTSELQGFLAALPRMPQDQRADASLDGPITAGKPTGALSGSPQLRSY